MSFVRWINRLALAFLILISLPVPANADGLPDGFVRLNDALPSALYEIRYYSGNNFVGERITGYEAPAAIISEPAAAALKHVLAELKPFGLTIKIFDAYRPQRAVDHFVRWAEDLNDTKTKANYYPDVQKQHLFRDGYIAAKSGHSRGSTVDLTIVDTASGKALNMGTDFDYFGLESWPDNDTMDEQVRANRALLQKVMQKNGFKHYEAEWWHFTLKNEPYPETYFDFPVQ